MTDGPAMTRAEALRAIATGLDLVGDLRADGLDLLGVGEMGIGNTTAASAIAAVLTGRPVALVTGRGTGIDDATHRRKIAAIERALAVNGPDPADPIGVLAAVGGLEIAVLVGVIVGAAAARIPVVLDGFITGAAALVAAALQPAIAPRLIAAHRSIEPGHAVVLDQLGSGRCSTSTCGSARGPGRRWRWACIVAAVRIRDEMATFESAAISGRRPSARRVRAGLTCPASSSSGTRRPPGRASLLRPERPAAQRRRQRRRPRPLARELARPWRPARGSSPARRAARRRPRPRSPPRPAIESVTSTTAGARRTSGPPRASRSTSSRASSPTSPATGGRRDRHRLARRRTAGALADRVAAAWRELVAAGDDGRRVARRPAPDRPRRWRRAGQPGRGPAPPGAGRSGAGAVSG